MKANDVADRIRRATLAGEAVTLSPEEGTVLLRAILRLAEQPRVHPLPDRRNSETGKIRVEGRAIHVGCGFYPDGSLGEVFLSVAKDGTMLRELVYGFAIAVSVALQRGVPLADLTAQFVGREFETGEGYLMLDAIFVEILELVARHNSPQEVADGATQG